jgi:hypothetical protein
MFTTWMVLTIAFDVVGVPSFQALNNDLLDYAAGYVMNITLTVNDWTDCAVPLLIKHFRRLK